MSCRRKCIFLSSQIRTTSSCRVTASVSPKPAKWLIDTAFSKRERPLKSVISLLEPKRFDIPEAIIMHESVSNVLSISITRTSFLLQILFRNSVDCFLITAKTCELSSSFSTAF